MNRIKSINNQIYLSVVALLVILMVGVGITYSWIEGGSTFRLATVGDDSVKTAAVPEKIKGKVTLTPGGTYDALDLAAAYDKNVNEKLDNDDVQGLYFAPVHSVDGKKFIFPIEFDSDGKAVKFRDANTNDIGTKFIKFSFDYKATKNSYLAFGSSPGVIARYSDGQQINDKSALSAFRFMISKTSTDGVHETHIFCPGDEARTTDVVTSSSFDTTVTPPTSPVTASIFNDKVVDDASNNRLFNLSANEEGKIEIAIWLDAADPYLTDEAVESILGRSVELSMNLVVEEPKVKVTFDARTFDSNGSPLDNFEGGKIKVGSKTADGKPLSVYFVKGAEITANALIKDESKFKFDGWYTDSSFSPDSKDYAAANLANRYANSEITYYAKFVEKSKYTINVSQTTVPAIEGVGGTVSINSNGTSCTDYEGTTITLTATPANDTFEFVGWFKNDAAAGTVSPMDVTIKEDRDGDTYVAKFVKKYTVDFKVRTDNDENNTSGGKVEIVNGDNTTTASSAVSVTVPYGSEITLKRNTTTSGYVYNGITKLSDSSTVADSNTDSVKVTVDGPETYYAEYTKKTSNTVYLKTTSAWREANARFACYLWNSSGNIWVNMTNVGEGIYKAEIPTGYSNIIFARFNPNDSTNNFDVDWGQTSDLIVQTDGKNMYVLNSNSWATYTSSKITITLTDATNNEWLDDDGAIMRLEDTSTGWWYQMSESGTTYTVSVPADITNIKFYRTTGSGSSQTTHNSWDAGNRGSSTTYKITGNSGSWQ